MERDRLRSVSPLGAQQCRRLVSPQGAGLTVGQTGLRTDHTQERPRERQQPLGQHGAAGGCREGVDPAMTSLTLRSGTASPVPVAADSQIRVLSVRTEGMWLRDRPRGQVRGIPGGLWERSWAVSSSPPAVGSEPPGCVSPPFPVRLPLLGSQTHPP